MPEPAPSVSTNGDGPQASGEGPAESFEAALQRLEGLVHELEEGELPLEASLERFEAGVGLVRDLRKRLEDARLRVQVLQDDGALREAPELVPDA